MRVDFLGRMGTAVSDRLHRLVTEASQRPGFVV